VPGYYVVAGGQDEKLPLNNIKVSLRGTSRTYTTYNLNNAFYYFDSIAPGDYKLYFEGSSKYMKDSLVVTVAANKTTIADKELKQDTTLVPVVANLLPALSTNVPLNQEWMFSFNVPMLPDSFVKAVSASPQVSLQYVWSDNNRKVTIGPVAYYAKNTNYTISVSSRACSRWKVKMEHPYAFSFQTVDRSTLLLEKSYPADNKNEISLTPQFRLYFDAPLDQLNAGASIILYDASNNVVAKAREEFVNNRGKGAYYFETLAPLALNTEYSLVLKSDLTDHVGAKLGHDVSIKFRTRVNSYVTGSVLVNYDDLTGFWDPNASGSTIGTDAAATTFTPGADRKISGTASGKLDYTFVNTSGGVCRVFNSNKPDFGENASSGIGVWVFGDLSYNKLEYWFYKDNSSTLNAIVVVDTIDWAGWELKTIPFSAIGSSGKVLFHSIVVSQTPQGDVLGSIYFDDAQLILNTSTGNTANEALTVTSFPNPFRDRNYLQYSLANTSLVKIEIVDILGRNIKTLYDDEQVKGSYVVEWDGTGRNGRRKAGIYMYRIEVTSATNAFRPIVKTIRCAVME
ncbi:MAG TPA: Ig-like domain-containing protein, partial [Bacteroidales bacterium]|nr:Ig-like domain-containing protein [Bacteroidales bacterium]